MGMSQTPILILKEGTKRDKGKDGTTKIVQIN